jgi:hypothetical protein
MPKEPEKPETPKGNESDDLKAAEKKKIGRIADEAARKGLKTTKRYDRGRGTFPRGGPSGMA